LKASTRKNIITWRVWLQVYITFWIMDKTEEYHLKNYCWSSTLILQLIILSQSTAGVDSTISTLTSKIRFTSVNSVIKPKKEFYQNPAYRDLKKCLCFMIETRRDSSIWMTWEKSLVRYAHKRKYCNSFKKVIRIEMAS